MSKWRDLNRMRDCGEAHCDLPAGFFRVNYFHGKEMRLADYVDEQRYHAGKMRFHNARLHGEGILCGLKLSVLEPEGTLLRVGRGAAIDACGREIVVGFDQCVDVAAWFRQQAYKFRDQDNNPCKPDEANRVKLCVAMRHAECGGTPEPVPPDPCASHDDCGCGCSRSGPCNGGDPCGQQAEFGRITEEFELRLMFADEAKTLTRHRLFPASEAIDNAIATTGGATGLLAALTPPLRERCRCDDNEWLNLGCFHATVKADHPDEVIAIQDFDYGCASQVLLSTEVIQYLLAGILAEVDPDIGGPEITSITFRRLDGQRHQFALHLSSRIDAKTLDDEASFGLRQLTRDGWIHPAGEAVKASYSEKILGEANLDGPAIYIAVASAFLAAGGRYHLFAHENADPVVDPLLRRLRPRHLSWRFCLGQDNAGDGLTMHPLGV
ncbi:hypothetical protein EYF88_10885 [Paracoccus sediminis]|uniref:Uncharacterized protein n=1 Tax=Paracoccus sediminis TaxID=1214787 RepID=A0A238WXM6_9RHOB|nr:hypothetical protein [Paracoccus sediminis]TBN50117.1 hypothetical protein EYF88_10885 [Paracoccus sediminis]SNR51262.1 hypothetical protein SAMN06265378_106191 [Paracoccus sediminis]